MKLLAFLLLAGGVAQADVSLAGDWKLNASRSDFGGAAGMSALTMKNTQEGALLKCSAKVSSDGGEVAYNFTFSMDGKETVNQVGSAEMKSTAAWEGDTLVLTTKGQSGGGDLTFRDKWSLSENGRTLTILRHISSSRGEMDQKLVLEKQAQARANFAGDWKLNTAKSDFGQFPAPSAMSQKNTHEEPSLKVSVKMATENGDFDWESAYKTDGTETTNQFGPSEMKSKAAWEGDVLVINTKGSFGESEVTMVDKWTLSADGKALTIQRNWKSSRGEMDQRLVLEKQ